jgi:hypothetical protein
VNWSGWQKRILCWPKCIFKNTTKIFWQIKPGNFQYNFRYFLGPQNNDHVIISDNNPTCKRQQSSKLIEIWELIAFETNKRNTNLDLISNENTFSILLTYKKYRRYHTMWIGAVGKKRISNSPKCIYSTPPKSVDLLNRHSSSSLFSTLWILKIRTMLILQKITLHVTDYSLVCWL